MFGKHLEAGVIRRIELVNFMSHTHTVIEPAEGLTVLVGPNNCGKSAVVAALQILCHNETSTYVTRHNERECSVTIETDDGRVIDWRRRKSPVYSLDGKPFDRLGKGGVPEELHDVLRLPKVSAEGGQEFDVHFGEQKSPVFLLDKPGSHAAQFFASSSDAASLVEMQRRHQQKTIDARRERARLDVRTLQLSTDLAAFAALDTIRPAMVDLEKQHADLQEAANFIAQMNRDLAVLQQVNGILEHHDSQSAALELLEAPPELTDVNLLVSLVQWIETSQVEFDRQANCARSLQSLPACPDVTLERILAALLDQMTIELFSLSRSVGDCEALHGLPPLPHLAPTQDLGQILGQLQSTEQNLTRVNVSRTVLANLAAIPEIVADKALAEDVCKLAQSISLLRSQTSAWACLTELKPAPPVDDVVPLTNAIRLLSDSVREVQQLKRHSVDAQDQLDQAAANLRAFAIETKICPTCGGVLDPDRLIGCADSHHAGGDGDV